MARKKMNRRSSLEGNEPEMEMRQHPIEMLKDDHQAVRGLFSRFEKASGKSRPKIADEALTMLDVHTQLEEKVIYPAIREAVGDDQAIDEAEEAHHAATLVMKELKKGKLRDSRYAAKFKILTENILRHIEREENETFPEAENADIEWDEVGEEAMKLRQRLLRKTGGAKDRHQLKKAA